MSTIKQDVATATTIRIKTVSNANTTTVVRMVRGRLGYYIVKSTINKKRGIPITDDVRNVRIGYSSASVKFNEVINNL